MSVRDRLWAPVDAIRAVGPLAGLSAESVRASLVMLHAEDPSLRAITRMDVPGRRWWPLSATEFDARLADIVIGVDPELPGGVDTVVRRLLPEVPGDRPMLLAVHRNYLAVRISHGVGDGRTVNRFLLDLLRCILHGRAAWKAETQVRPARTRAPLARAALRHFGRHPTALLSACRLRQPPAQPRGAPQPWAPRQSYSSARSSCDGLRALRAWRDARLPGVSIASISFAAVPAALRLAGLAPHRPGIVTLVDARRYLHRGSLVDGNFSWGQYMVPADLEDPRAIDAALRTELASGRALVMLALRDVRGALLPRVRTLPPTIGPVPGPELTVTHLGRLDAFTELPWSGDREAHRFVVVPPPAGPAAVTFSLAEMGGTLHVTAGFHASTFDQAAMDRVVELVATDPAGLVMPGAQSGG